MNRTAIRSIKARVTILLPRIKSSLLSMLVVLSVGVTNADDTEIFTGVVEGEDSSVELNPDFFPNVLFILDNSTSMGETEPILDRIVSLVDDGSGSEVPSCNLDLSSYDPDYDYSFGNDTNDSNIYIYNGTSFQGKVVSAAQNQCKSYLDNVVNGNNNPPLITSQLIQWGLINGSNSIRRWDGDLDNFDTDPTSGVECRADYNIHGHFTRNTGDRRPRNFTGRQTLTDIGEYYFSGRPGSFPYSNADTVSWVAPNYHRYLQLVSGASSLPSVCAASTSTGTFTPFDLSEPKGTRNNPDEASDLSQTCGFSFADRDANTGRSRLNFTNGTTQYYKNRYYKIVDVNNSDLVNVYRCQTRLEIMKEALERVITAESGINAGLMRFNRNNGSQPGGGTVVTAVSPLNDEDNKAALLKSINELEFAQSTPLAESLYEAYRYFAGLSIDQGRKTPGSWNSTHATFDEDFRNFDSRVRTQFETDSRAKSGDSYVSPIKTQCQPNSIILLSDGEPSNDNNRNNTIGNLTGSSCSNCSDDIAAYMKSANLAPVTGVNSGVNTYTIGLNLDSSTLENIANAGGPDDTQAYFTASDTNALESAFRSILGNIESTEADTFSAPAVTVNAFNRLQNREDIYYALFKPENSIRWGGNVKKYRVRADATIVDANNDNAIDSREGFFVDTSQSIWSADEDGSVVSEGGAGSNLVFPRQIYGQINGDVVFLSSDQVSDAATKFNEATESLPIGASTSGGDTLEENRLKIATWTLGLDIDQERDSVGTFTSNQYVGDSLHGTPYVLSFGADEDDPEDVIFYTSNQGLVQAIDGDGGAELWSYVPDESLFSNLGQYYNNETADRIYGLDAELAFKITRDPTTDLEIDAAQLFFGQRRGGNKLFSIDVTNALLEEVDEDPVKHVWTIDGGIGGTPGFERLGQTWAEPVVSEVNYCDDDSGCEEGNSRSVLFVSGGYDEFYDNPNNNLADVSSNVTISETGGVTQLGVVGNSVYMIDSNTGELLWMVTGSLPKSEEVNKDRHLVIPEMKHSIVSKPTVIDSDSNGTVDTLFITDITGQIFRVDFRTSRFDDDDVSSGDNTQAKETTIAGSNPEKFDNVSGGLIADFSEAGVNRRFYSTLDITTLPEQRDSKGKQIAKARYAITTGSGYRAHPLSSELFGNRIYVLYDSNILLPLSEQELDPQNGGIGPVYTYNTDDIGSPDIIRADSLSALDIISLTQNSGSNLVSNSGELSATPPVSNSYYVNMPNTSEKLLNPGLISDFRLVTVSYLPASNNASNLNERCEAGLGTSIVYSLNLLTGGVEQIFLNNPGLSPSPVTVYLIDGDKVSPVVIVGTEPIEGEELKLSDLKLGKAEKKAWWENGRIQ